MQGIFSDLRKVPVVRVVFPFAAGLLLQPIAGFSGAEGVMLLLLWAGMILLFMVHLTATTFFLQMHFVFGTGVILVSLAGGLILGGLPSFRDPDRLPEGSCYIVGRVMDAPVEKTNSWSISIAASYFFADSAEGILDENIRLYFPPDSMVTMSPGETWIFRGMPRIIRNRGNPGEFDYQAYMQRRNFRYTFFVSSLLQAAPVPGREIPPKYIPVRLRERIIGQWDNDDQAAAVLSAITLGQKAMLDRQTKNAFSHAGAMHLLAVSGLHVGMVWMMLDLLIRLPVHMRLWRSVKLMLILAVLWFYAAITGFSESVTRSVTMFSLVTVSTTMNRRSGIFNSLLLSAFILLVHDPDRVLEPGFRLSYLAVFGIVTLQPRFARLYHDLKKPVRKVLDLVSVSVAAQLSTLPLTILYFNQFPVWFIFTNLAAIPLVTVLLGTFVVFSPLLVLFPSVPVFSTILLKLSALLHTVVSFISSMPLAVVEEIPLDSRIAAGLMLCLLSFTGLLIYRRSVYLLLLGFALLLTVGGSVLLTRQIRAHAYVEIFNFSNATVISRLEGSVRHTFVWHEHPPDDPYLASFLGSLKRIPGPLKVHSLHEPMSGNTCRESEYLAIARGLWGLEAGGCNILVAGNTGHRAFEKALESGNWDVILFCTGFPRYRQGLPDTGDAKLVGDGTLRYYELQYLQTQAERVYAVSESGAFRFSLTAGDLSGNWGNQ